MTGKSFVTNLIAVLIIVAGYLSPAYQPILKSTGFFALSGAITNWLAVHMLFEKVPFLYGSGVIPNRFEDFKKSIKILIMEQFFTVENIERFIEREEQKGGKILNLDPLLDAIEYEKIYQSLIEAIMNSSFGAMLMMMGGEDALQPLKEPFIMKIRSALTDMTESERFKEALAHGLDAHVIGVDIADKIETLIDKRLEELTPKLVKEIVQSIIKQHLGWLVVWGGVFGGILGAMFSYL